jgi:membrane protein DedA with SNARE-associated domain
MVEAFTETLHNLVHSYPEFAPVFVFLCIACSSITFVMSLDLLLFTGAMIAVYFESFTPFLLACYLGTFFCGQVDYWIGRLVGRPLLQHKRIAKLLPQQRLEQVQGFFHKYGAMTFIVGRFIPFGFRLAMFIGAGIFKFHYIRFVLTDLLASFVWTTCVFTLFYHFGANTDQIKEKWIYLLPVIALAGIIYLFIRLKRKRYAISTNDHIANKDSFSSSVSDDEP